MAHNATPVLSRLGADFTQMLSMNVFGTTPAKQHTDTHLSRLIKCLVKNISSHHIRNTIMYMYVCALDPFVDPGDTDAVRPFNVS